ncbi:hypothetical protein GCM10016455_29570 [Aliiroseovarius zhejiangensis]|uniref:Polysaccharide pyruvyl transferase domain-containing protein n=1 Tax=Aliiroseovarius zhejiangensis TaxID=1632025 RepID=A0ABQ3J9H0_9RHOB|nr:polysaccharide pyruvyl transferase family protein [Aliiroseovarius zhejiangensis]GHF06480.1 hypothetical protein GCM10016455_29570 [Aliiroseovarius zhejiangensis]
MIDVVLTFHGARNDNLGVGALTASEVEILRSISNRTGIKVNIIIIDAVGPREVYITGPDIRVENIRVLRQPHKVARLMRDADLVIDIGAGDSFTDIYGRKRLKVLFMLKYLAHLTGCPLVTAPQTIGPFTKPLSRLLAKRSLHKSAIVATRDDLSTECARELGVGGSIVEASDVALRLPYDRVVKSEGGPVKVGLNVSGLLMSGGYTGKNMFGLRIDYRQLVHDIIERFLNHDVQCEMHLVPHVISAQKGSVEDDLHACEELARAYPLAIAAPAFQNPSEAKSYISGLDFFMGARMHSCIAAFSSGVPVVPMAYSRKFAGLFGSLGYPYTVDCTTDPGETIIENIFDAFENRQQVAEEMAKAFKLGSQKLQAYEDALETLICQIDSSH